MSIRVASTAGFCFGVKRAVEMVEEGIRCGGKLYTYGEIIHNPQVVEGFRRRGVFPVNSPEEISEGTVVIRSHGTTPTVMEQFSQKKIKILDATCPFVRRIQNIVRNALRNRDFIVIIGEAEHPEVIGINGHCGNSGKVINSVEEAEALDATERQVCVVAQTTSRGELFDKIVSCLKNKYASVHVWDTICDATAQRQKEAMELAAQSDVMVVIGGRQSSNTAKLYRICKEYCTRTYAVETAEEASAIKIEKNEAIGITAGASTPDWLIKEVVEKMSENEKLNEQGSNFEEELDKTLVKIHPGQIMKGKVIYVKPDEVSVDIGYKADGLIAKDQLASGDEALQAGDEIDVKVVKVNDGNGNVLLSRKAVVAQQEASKALLSIRDGQIFEVTVGEAVKGGLTANYNGIRVFIPQSQIRAKGFVKDLSKFVGQTLRVRAIEVDEEHRKVVATHGQVVAEEREAQLNEAWGKLEEGATVHGIVRRLADFGAFVDVGGVDGLVHIGDIAWYHINKPSDVLAVGQEIDVVILGLDRERERISLGYKQLQPKPWDDVVEKYPVDTVVRGTVVRITSFGAFVSLEPGVDGLVHISEVSNKYVSKVDEAVHVGDVIDALVLDVNPEAKRISLSIKALLPEEAEVETEAEPEAEMVEIEE